jgi:hypothetical protein
LRAHPGLHPRDLHVTRAEVADLLGVVSGDRADDQAQIRRLGLEPRDQRAKQEQQDVVVVVAATCALAFAWAIAATWSLPWYATIAWMTLALLPRNSLTRWLTLATGALALPHFNGRWSSTPMVAQPLKAATA